MLPQNKPDRIRILFDDHRLVANAGLLLPATLARHLGLRELVDHHLDLGGAPGRANTGDKMLTGRIDDAVARWWDGRCSRLRGQGAIHPGDLPAQLPVGASTRPHEPPVVGPGWAAGAGPGDSPLTIDLDSRDLWLAKEGARHHGYLSPAAGHCRRHRRGADVPAAEGRATPPVAPPTSCVNYGGARGQLTVRADSGFYAHTVVAACREMDVRFSITIRQRASLRDLIEAEEDDSHSHWMDGAADVAETTYTPFQTKPDAAPVRLIVRRVKPTPGSQLRQIQLSRLHHRPRWGDAWRPTSPPRRGRERHTHLKYGVGLNHAVGALRRQRRLAGGPGDDA